MCILDTSSLARQRSPLIRFAFPLFPAQTQRPVRTVEGRTIRSLSSPLDAMSSNVYGVGPINMSSPGLSGPGDKTPSGVFSPLQSPLSSPRINYPPLGFAPASIGPGLSKLQPLTSPPLPPQLQPQTGGSPNPASSSSFHAPPSNSSSAMVTSSSSFTSSASNTTTTHLPAAPPVSSQAALSTANPSTTYEHEVERMSTYARTKLDSVMKEMLMSVFASSPVDPVQVRTAASSHRIALHGIAWHFAFACHLQGGRVCSFILK
jgi:hypothetical protein